MAIEKHYTAHELAELLSLDYETVLQKARAREIGSIRIGRFRRFPESDVQIYLAQQRDNVIPLRPRVVAPKIFPHIVGSLALRLGEALGLTDDRVDVKAGAVFIPAAMCKERRDKLVELTATERVMLTEQLLARPAGTPFVFPRAGGQPTGKGGRPHLPGRWDKGDFYTRVWHPARQAAAREWREDRRQPAWEPTRFDSIVPHDLRHTGISLMAASGMRPETIAVRVGHKDGGKLILERYRHLFPDELTAHLERYDSFVNARRDEQAAAADGAVS